MWLTRSLLFGVAFLSIALAAACGGGGGGGSGDKARDQAVAAMAEVESYRTEFDFGLPPGLVWEYVKPDSYRTFFGADHVEGDIRTRAGGSEILYIGESIYTRKCDDVDTNCQEWKSSPRGSAVIYAPSPSYYPQWPLVALEMAKDLKVSTKGGALRLVGTVNTMRAVLESLKRILDQEGRTDFGRECSSSAVQIGEDEAPPTPAPVTSQETCRDTTYQDMLEQEADDIAFSDERPATIAATVEKDSHLVLRIEIELPSREVGQEPAVFIMGYSQFGMVTIEAPE